jgi:leucine dehydrogenase
MRTAAERVHGAADLSGLTIAIQGVGNVGARLARRLAADGARLTIADLDQAKAREVADETGATLDSVDDILASPADILAPCALGGVLSAQSIPALRARIVVGGANNQLATPDDDQRLRAAGVLYCPDYLANAGGIIDLHYQRSRWAADAVEQHVASLAVTFHEIIERSEAMGLGTARVADEIARERFMRRS